ncbi:hypothetical protein CDD83_463 [Cordyceps sp. RAO-2017]|nr:hypothetical protein CDD83_463 [Cordyceps sp. RAO-2017]
MANPNEPQRRFAPVPIETTFQSVRKTARQTPPPGVGPNPELTPDPSPRSASPIIPEPQHKGRFHPQLIETSRRTRRAGDAAPATKPTDKTDITPYTNHIYLARPRPRRKRGDTLHDDPVRHMPPTRRETEDEGVQEYLLELTARETARQIEEAALAAFPNSRAREGGVAHFYFRESSDSDNSTQDTRPPQRDHGQSRPRRKSSNLGLNWWHKHMQEHAEHLAHGHAGDDAAVAAADADAASAVVATGGDDDVDTVMTTDSDLDQMDLAVPPNPLWTTSNMLAPQDRRDSVPVAHQLGRCAAAADDVDMDRVDQAEARPGRVSPRPGDREPEAVPGPAPDPGQGARPFGAFGLQPEDPKLHLMRQAASPPMLGKDLVFRKCPSPKQTKLETDHPPTTAASCRRTRAGPT